MGVSVGLVLCLSSGLDCGGPDRASLCTVLQEEYRNARASLLEYFQSQAGCLEMITCGDRRPCAAVRAV